ncbi:MAG: OmpH family outer membrane protein [Bacteroides sp.]|nr:OmpH family outer membrane protein [Bacteroidales bacterium]MCI6679686.1 OmpH family outer membrane protein [Bacteroides sp.]MDD7489754.1 OmpH family outer membrane protein [Bacteroides sp.]
MNKASLFSAAVLTGLSLIAASCNNTQQNTTGENKAPEATAAQGAIVYFNLDTILNDYDMANDLRSVVETKVNSINQEVTRRRNKIEKDIKAFSDKLNKGLLTQSVAQTQNQKLVEQQQSFETYAGQKQQEILEEQQVMMNQIADAINNYITEFNADGKYAMIIATQGDILSTPVVAADPALDITDILLEGLNAAYVKEKNSQK